MEPLTRRQQDVLHHITDVRAAKGTSPNLREIAAAFSISIGSVYDHLSALRRKGYLTIDRNAHRGVQPTRSRREWKVRQGWRSDFEKRFGARLSGGTDLSGIFAIVREEFPAWLEVERAELLVHDAARRVLRNELFYSPRSSESGRGASPTGDPSTSPKAGAGPRTGDAGEGIADRALRRRKAVIEGNVAAIPIPGRDHLLGVLRLEVGRSGVPDEALLTRAGLAAAAVVPALERATLDAELRHRIRLQSALVSLCRTVNRGGDLLPILRDIHGLVSELVDTAYFVIAAKDDDGKWWNLLERDVVDGKPWEFPGTQPSDVHKNEGLRTIQTRPYYIKHRTPEEVRALEGRGPGHVSPDGWGSTGNLQKRSRSILYVPLRSAGEWIGYISAQSYRYDAYTIRDAEDLILVGEYIGLAVQDAWRRQRERAELGTLRTHVKELKAEIARMKR